MMCKELQTITPATVISSTDTDWDEATPQFLENMLVQMMSVRSFEQALLDLARQGLIHGPMHSSIGQEGAAIGSILALAKDDQVNGTHRGHHQFVGKALHYLRPEGMNLVDAIKGDDVEKFIYRTLSEIMGLKDGFSGGRGGSMHLQWLEAGALGTNAIVGGGVPLAAGNAWAQRHEAQLAAEGSTPDMPVTVSYFGDGASNIGSTLETLNLAAAWKLPLCFFIENNQYAVATFIEDVIGDEELAARGIGFGVTSYQVDGMDPMAVYLAQREALAHMRAGKGPTLIEAKTYRYYHQNGPFPGSAFGYRTKEEEQDWKARDPIELVVSHMERRGLLTSGQRDDLASRLDASIAEVIDRVLEQDPESDRGGRRVKPTLWPITDSVNEHIRKEYERGTVIEGTRSLPTDGAKNTRFNDAIAAPLDYRMANDAQIVVMGEDVHELKGGTNGATKGLKAAYPDRVLGTPIAENAFTGLAGGLAMTGRYKPIVEFMYPDFMWVAGDQVFNQIGKARHMYGGQSSMPVILRTKVATGGGYGSQHSMDPAGIFATSPGWRIVAPSCAQDYIGLMNTALDLEDPVLVMEHIDFYLKQEPVHIDQLDYRLPVGIARVAREGSDVTVLTYFNMVQPAVDVANSHGKIDAEVIDLRWLDRASIDWETISESVKKTNSVLIVEQGAQGTSYGSWLADEIQRRLFDWLDQPVQRVTGSEASPSISKVLESAANAGADDIRHAFDNIAHGLGRN